MQAQEVKHCNFPRAFQCICAELSSGPGASWGPSIEIAILDNVLHWQDITTLYYVPLNTAFCALHQYVPSTAHQCWYFWVDMAVYKAQPGNTLQFRHTGKNALHPRKLTANTCPVFSGRCGHTLPVLWDQPVIARLQLGAVAQRTWVSRSGGASILHCRAALQRWAPGEGALCVCMVQTKIKSGERIKNHFGHRNANRKKQWNIVQ